MIFLIACSSSNEIVAKKLTKDIVSDVKETEPDVETKSCEKVICSEGFVCEEGECVCKGNLCGEKCIINGCCEDNDCEDEKHCVDFKCISKEICEYHQIFDEEQQKCICEEGYFYCDEQKKCLVGGSCCHQGDCDRYSDCVDTSWAVRVCFQYPNKKMCRMLRNLRMNENIDSPEGEFFVMFDNILSGGIVKIKIDDEFYELQPEKRINTSKGTVWTEEIKIFGGICKVDEE